jgi:hypothetical protein
MPAGGRRLKPHRRPKALVGTPPGNGDRERRLGLKREQGRWD